MILTVTSYDDEVWLEIDASLWSREAGSLDEFVVDQKGQEVGRENIGL